MCVTGRWQQFYQDGSFIWVERSWPCDSGVLYYPCGRHQTIIMEPTQVDSFALYEPIVQTVEPPLTYVATPRYASDETKKDRSGGKKKPSGKGGFVEQVRLVWKGTKGDDKKKKNKKDSTKNSRPATPSTSIPPPPPPLQPWQTVFPYEEYERGPYYRPSSRHEHPSYKFPIPPAAPYAPHTYRSHHEREERPIYEVIRPVRDGDSGYGEAPPSPLIEHIRPPYDKVAQPRHSDRGPERRNSFSTAKKQHVRFEEPPRPGRRHSTSEPRTSAKIRVDRLPSPEPIVREQIPQAARAADTAETPASRHTDEMARLNAHIDTLQRQLDNARFRELQQDHLRRLDEKIAATRQRLNDEKRKQQERDDLLRAMRRRQSEGRGSTPVIRYPNRRRGSITHRPSDNPAEATLRTTPRRSLSTEQRRNNDVVDSGYLADPEPRVDSYRRSDPNPAARPTQTVRIPQPHRSPPNLPSRVWEQVDAAEQRAREEADRAKRQAERQAAERRHSEMLAREELRRADERYAEEQRRRREMRRNRDSGRDIFDGERRNTFHR